MCGPYIEIPVGGDIPLMTGTLNYTSYVSFNGMGNVSAKNKIGQVSNKAISDK